MNGNEEKTIYELFQFSLWIKVFGSVGEMVGGIFIAFIPSAFVLNTALLLAQGESDSDDFLSRGLLSAAHSFAISNNAFIGAYLFVRGLVQFLLVIALFRNKLWAYPLLILVLLILVITQVYDIYLSHSIATGVITVVDIVTIYLVWHEYQVVRKVTKGNEK